MPDIILDTNVLGEFLAQYFSSALANRGFGQFAGGKFLSDIAARQLNRIIAHYASEEEPLSELAVIPSFAFVELVRRWDEIVKARFTTEQLEAFLRQPPDWVSIATLDETLLPAFMQVPTHVFTQGTFKAVEWTDAVHAATALARGDGHQLATADQVLRSLNMGSRLQCV
jgi:predicted nucleic acid-binding protein